MQIPNDLLLTTNSTLESRRSREGRLTYARGVRFREPQRPGAGYERWRRRLWRPTGRPARVQGPTAHARELHLFALGGGRIPPSFRGRRVGGAHGWAGLSFPPPPAVAPPEDLVPWHRKRACFHSAGARSRVPITGTHEHRTPPSSPAPGRKARALRRLYLAVHLALLFHVDMGEFGRGSQWVDVADKWQPRRSRGEARRPSLLQQLADAQGEEKQEEDPAEGRRERLGAVRLPHGLGRGLQTRAALGPGESANPTTSYWSITPEVPPQFYGHWLAERRALGLFTAGFVLGWQGVRPFWFMRGSRHVSLEDETAPPSSLEKADPTSLAASSFCGSPFRNQVCLYLTRQLEIINTVVFSWTWYSSEFLLKNWPINIKRK